MASPRIADLAEVTAAETVVRLDGTADRLQELVLTGDVQRSLTAVLDAARGGAGAGFMVVGHFGSGKSHFLAAVGELLEEPEKGRDLAGWDAETRRLAAAARPSLVVPVPLVEYRADVPLEDVVWGRAWHAAGRPAPPATSDRAASWARLLEAGRPGLLLLLDELSEFLRAKQGPALTEDLRFLQFLGEWARSRPVIVLGALQESIEEVASVSQRELARIRDRYPLSLSLSMRHVQDLVRGRLVRLRPGAEATVVRAYGELKRAFPRWQVTPERFLECYPVHPETLALLDGLRFVLSQQRGVVDFICRQLRGDPAAGLPAWSERPYDELITPDRVYDHFSARLHERVETNRLAETVVPYYERAAEALFDSETDREAALRAVKVLALISASPLERRRGAAELAEMLLVRVSTLDPSANYSYIERAVLDVLAEHGAYVVARPEQGRTVYAVELEADAAVTAAARLAQARAELQPGDRRVIDGLVELGSTPTLPLHALRQGPTRREVIWQNTLRHVLVTAARVAELEPAEVDELVRRTESTRAEVCLVVAELEEVERPAAFARDLAAASDRLAIWAPDRLSAAEREFAVDLFCRRVVLEQARREGGGPAGLGAYLERSIDADQARAREVLARCYFRGRLVSATGDVGDLPSLSGMPFDRLLRPLVNPLLASLHPRHQEVQPNDELVGERLLRQVLERALAAPRTTVAAAEREHVRKLIEDWLVPLGAVRKRSDHYVVAPDPARSAAVAELLRLVPGEEPVAAAEVAGELAAGPVGLTEPETLLLLNAAVQGGLLEAFRRRRPVAAPFFSLAEVDQLRSGELVAPELRERVPELGAIFGPGPFEPWNARVQQSCWEHARAWMESRQEEMAQVGEALASLGASALLPDADPGPAPADLERMAAVLDGADLQATPRAGLERLLRAMVDPEPALGAAARLAALARFVRVELQAVTAAVEYLTHPDLAIPSDQERLARLREEVLGMARHILGLAAEDRAGEFASAHEQFRRAFAAVYEEAHARHYGAARPVAARVVASPEYRALAALSEIGATSVPDDRVKVDRALAAATPEPCRRQVPAELRWRPLCGCGFKLGDPAPELDAAALITVAARGVAQHLAELGGGANRGRLERAAEDLASLERGEAASDLRRLLELAGAPDADPVALARLLAGPLRDTLPGVLGGARIVVRRDLARLREDLIGRRYPRRRLLELLREWVGDESEAPEGAFVEVVDSAEASPVEPAQRGEAATVALLRRRFPDLASTLPAERGADAFWLAAWWSGRPHPPAWLPSGLLEQPELMEAARRVALEDEGARRELAALDARVGPRSLVGDQVAAALELSGKGAPEVVADVFGERLLRHPLRLAADELLRRMAGHWQLVDRLPLERPRHALAQPDELGALEELLAAARHLAALERRLGDAGCRELVEDVYPTHAAPVPDLLSRASLSAARGGMVPPDTVEAFRAAARRLLQRADAAFREAAPAGFPGCMRIWEVGTGVVEPLLVDHDRVAVLLVDAMRADLWLRLRDRFVEALPGRRLVERWAVVPEPTRTAEATAALHLGRPVEAGAAPEPPPRPFSHLGYESRLLVAADRDVQWERLLDLWSSGPPLAVVAVGGVDERLHRTPVELAGLLDEAVADLSRRVLPSLRALPGDVPLVVLADHGFRENLRWGGDREGRYAHGGLSLEESVVPVAALLPD